MLTSRSSSPVAVPPLVEYVRTHVPTGQTARASLHASQLHPGDSRQWVLLEYEDLVRRGSPMAARVAAQARHVAREVIAQWNAQMPGCWAYEVVVA